MNVGLRSTASHEPTSAWHLSRLLTRRVDLVRETVILGIFASSPMLGLAMTVGPGQSLDAFHQYGQTYLTWPEADENQDTMYRIYRSPSPILFGQLDECEVLDVVGQGSRYNPAADREFRVPGESGSLADGFGLYVVTVLEPRRSYYAVHADSGDKAIGRKSLYFSAPVDENPASPQPVLQWRAGAGERHPGDYYVVWLGSADPTGKHPDYGYANRHSRPFCFRVCVPEPYDRSQEYPLLLVLHSGMGSWQSYESEFGDCIALIPDDHLYFTSNPRDCTWTIWYGYNCNLRTAFPLDQGVVVNYTERSLLYVLDWVMQNLRIDADRVYCWGSSLGGMGALTFGLRHPEVFAMVDAQFANVDQRNDTWFESRIAAQTGTTRTNEAIDLWDRLNVNLLLRSHPGELPFFRLWNGKRDILIKWNSMEPPSTFVEFVKTMNESRHGGLFVWTDDDSYFGHGGDTPADRLV